MSNLKTKKRKLAVSRKSFPIVNSLANLEVGRIYKTKKYSILLPLEHNRGEATGFQTKRVKKITKLIDENVFFMDVCHVLVNLRGDSIDGNNRLQALKERGSYVNFMLTAQKEFNVGTDSEILNYVSDFNNINPSWGGNDSYESALAFFEPAALEVQRVRDIIINLGMKKGTFTPSRLIGIALKDSLIVASNKQPRRMYCRQDIASAMKTPEFEADLEFIIEVMKFAEGTYIKDKWHAVKSIMPYIWNDNVPREQMLKSMKKIGFADLNNIKLSGVQDRVFDFVQALAPKKRK